MKAQQSLCKWYLSLACGFWPFWGLDASQASLCSPGRLMLSDLARWRRGPIALGIQFASCTHPVALSQNLHLLLHLVICMCGTATSHSILLYILSLVWIARSANMDIMLEVLHVLSRHNYNAQGLLGTLDLMVLPNMARTACLAK